MSVPLVRLNSLDLLRGFVAVGRRMSITLAAEDLCLTQSAVSRQVAALEEQLATKLLVRGHRSIRFTSAGEKLFKTSDLVMQQLQDVIGSLHCATGGHAVTLSASVGVVGLWLLPRLGALHEQLPDIDVHIAASNRVIDLKAEGVDLAIRYCSAEAAPEGSELMFSETLFPVAHPSLQLRGRDVREVLQQHALLDFDDPKRPWLQWESKLKGLGVGDVKLRGVFRFNQYDQLIHAATGARGIALGRSVLVAPLLEAGGLEQLAWEHAAWRSNHHYWLVHAAESPREEVKRVLDWIRVQSSSACRTGAACGVSCQASG